MLSILFMIMAILANLVGFAFMIVILVKIFKENTGLGILGIFFPAFIYVYGWIKVKDYKCMKLMIAWTGLTVVAILGMVLSSVFAVHEVAETTQDLYNRSLNQFQNNSYYDNRGGY